ncbi:Solute carrier family 41 member 2 [Termitomyces sp. J132]|nr:Solute carrier family 41 member 2 [Termitomyces sp. J132]
MTGLNDIEEKPPPQSVRDSIDLHNIDDDDDDDDDEDSHRALLRSYGHSLTSSGLLKNARYLWPQIRGIVTESAPTLSLTTVGLLLTGKFLDNVSHWHAMKEVHQLIMIIPVLLNLKGNLEMNLSARLCTAANIGQLDDPTICRSMILGNLALLQVQAAVVSFIAAWIAYLLGIILPRSTPAPISSLNNTSMTNLTTRALDVSSLISRQSIPIPTDNYNSFIIEKLAMVASTGMTAAALSSVVLGSFMCALIVICRWYGRDPDNIAPPVASCLGDLVTLLWMSAVSATLIGCGAGIVLDTFASRYEGFMLLSVVISDLPGSVGSILISRLSLGQKLRPRRSTPLHAGALSLVSPDALTGSDSSSSSNSNSKTSEPSTRLVMITLALVTLPVDIIFLAILRGLGWLRLPLTFVLLSVFFFFCAELISLYVAKRLTHYLWSKDCDPDMYALPIHSAFMDLVGHILLAMCFELVQLFIDVRVKPDS